MRRLVAACGDSYCGGTRFSCGVSRLAVSHLTARPVMCPMRPKSVSARKCTLLSMRPCIAPSRRCMGPFVASGYLGGPAWLGDDQVPCNASVAGTWGEVPSRRSPQRLGCSCGFASCAATILAPSPSLSTRPEDPLL